jgi:hypothetical protein
MKTAATLNWNRRKGRNAKNKGQRAMTTARAVHTGNGPRLRKAIDERAVRLAGHAGDYDQDGRGD